MFRLKGKVHSIDIDDDTVLGRVHGSKAFKDDNAISRQHLKLEIIEEKLYIEDLNSRNKTYVNREPIIPGKSILLNHGDIIKFGRQAFIVQYLKEDDVPPEPILEKTGDANVLAKSAKVTAAAVAAPTAMTMPMPNKKEIDNEIVDRLADEEEFSEIQKFHDSDSEDLDSYPPASRLSRIVASFIDSVILGVIFQVLAVMGKFAEGKLSVAQAGIALLVAYITIFYFYYVRPQSQTGQTLGKKVMGIKLVSFSTGEYLNGWNIFFREALFKGIATGLWLFTIPMWLINKERRALHDHISSSKVISIKG
jgi:pSer/pThr/pTyr-binding forkhead associated (FHA) protein/uncharacterized RDD family membrane protein YckC